jgi:S-adenosylmethionine synthetase
MRRNGQYVFTSESVARGHPDKLSDQISDLILDCYLSECPEAHAGIETLVTTNKVIIAGEVRGPESIKQTLEEKVRSLVKEVGYEQDGFHYEHLSFSNYLHNQSSDIAQGVDQKNEEDMGAGDQGIMFGYACNDTDTYMPAPLFWSHRLLESLEASRRARYSGMLGPDAKTQITFKYEDNIPVSIKTIVLSTQHHADVNQDDLRALILPIIHDTLPTQFIDNETEILINPTGRFVIGGPDGDCGLTGRKVIVDTYGGAAPHGGGAFSGKDPTKVDRSAAYMARYLAKNIVASGLSSKCLIQLSYGIGIARPLSLYLDFEGQGNIPESIVEKAILENFSLTPYSIIKHLNLRRPIYQSTACYGHFGRQSTKEGEFSWEKTDCLDLFKKL